MSIAKPVKCSVIFARPINSAYEVDYVHSLHKASPGGFMEIHSMPTGEAGDSTYQYTAALNRGAKQASGEWLLFSNDDVLCTAPFLHMLDGLDKNNIYGMELRRKTEAEWGADVEYLYGWLLLMHRDLYDDIGGFEEAYDQAGFDDIDICWTAQQKGYGLKVLDLPFIHLADQPGGTHRRYKVDGYKEAMARNKQIFLAKVELSKADTIENSLRRLESEMRQLGNAVLSDLGKFLDDLDSE